MVRPNGSIMLASASLESDRVRSPRPVRECLYRLASLRCRPFYGNSWPVMAVRDGCSGTRATMIRIIFLPLTVGILESCRAEQAGEGRGSMMLVLRQLFDPQSSTYTYLLGDRASGAAVLI